MLSWVATAGTPSTGTGPSQAAVGTGYIHAETSGPANYNADFDLSRTLPAGVTAYGFAFQYHMFGAAMGSAVLETSADGTSWTSLWSKSGEQGNQWLQATAYAGSGQTMLRYTCVPI